jgi:hypothetical protein
MAISVGVLIDSLEPQALFDRRLFSLAICDLTEADQISLIAMSDESASRVLEARKNLNLLNSVLRPQITVSSSKDLAETFHYENVCFSGPNEIVYHSAFKRLCSVMERQSCQAVLGAFRIALVKNLETAASYVDSKQSFYIAHYETFIETYSFFPLSAAAIARSELRAICDGTALNGNSDFIQAIRTAVGGVASKRFELSDLPCAESVDWCIPSV